jgi:hypothetical protein
MAERLQSKHDGIRARGGGKRGAYDRVRYRSAQVSGARIINNATANKRDGDEDQ